MLVRIPTSGLLARLDAGGKLSSASDTRKEDRDEAAAAGDLSAVADYPSSRGEVRSVASRRQSSQTLLNQFSSSSQPSLLSHLAQQDVQAGRPRHRRHGSRGVRAPAHDRDRARRLALRPARGRGVDLPLEQGRRSQVSPSSLVGCYACMQERLGSERGTCGLESCVAVSEGAGVRRGRTTELLEPASSQTRRVPGRSGCNSSASQSRPSILFVSVGHALPQTGRVLVLCGYLADSH